MKKIECYIDPDIKNVCSSSVGQGMPPQAIDTRSIPWKIKRRSGQRDELNLPHGGSMCKGSEVLSLAYSVTWSRTRGRWLWHEAEMEIRSQHINDFVEHVNKLCFILRITGNHWRIENFKTLCQLQCGEWFWG